MSLGRIMLVAVLAGGAWLGGCGASLWAQQQALLQIGDSPAPPDEFSKVQLVTDRVAARGMKRAQDSIRQGEFSQAIAFLDGVLGRPEDLFIELDDEGRVAGLKETARALLRDLPPAGRAAYEAAFGPVAQRRLAEALEQGDERALDEVAGRYFYTAAGSEAALLAAINEADAGRHLAAALGFQQLLDAPEAVRRFDPQLSIRAAASWLAVGDERRAAAIIEQLAARGEQSIQIGDRQHRLDASAEPLQWLRNTVGQPKAIAAAQEAQWLTYRGNAARNGESPGGLPHMRVRWQVRLLGHPALDKLFENLASDLVRSGGVAPVASHALAAGDYILTRTPQGLLAVDVRTGKRVWRSEPKQQPELLQLMQSGGALDETANPEPARSFARRLWEDYLYGITSSDGSRVYMIRDLPMPAAHEYEATPFMAAPQAEPASESNRLSAYDLSTQGKLVWEVDGAAAGELAGAFFLGAPLPVGESLYVLAEMKGAIHLIALDRASGEFQWQQPLANLEVSVHADPQRRLQAAMPSYEAGMLVCPTNAGVVLGVDLAKRSLAWAFRYEVAGQPPLNFRGRGDEALERIARRWLDGAATIVGQRVLLTPPDSDYLHAVELSTGKLLWKQQRGEMNRLAAVNEDRILLTGPRKARALRLADGKPAWARELALPAGVYSSGTGFHSGGRYYLPTTSAEVVAINMADGQVTGRAAARDGVALGNLICYRGAVISQNGMYLNCYDQIDVLRQESERRLAEQSDDVHALRTLGEIAYNEGRLSDAIALMERAFRKSPADIEAREVLAECLVAALDEDFAAFSSRLPLLKELEGDGAAQRAVILRIEAQGRLLAGDPLASAEACLELYRAADGRGELLKIGRDHEVAVADWVRSQLAEAWSAANPQQRSQIESLVRTELDGLGGAPQGEDLARVLDYFGSLPLAEPFKLARARELHASGDVLGSQQLLLDLENSAEEAVRAEAVGRIAEQLHSAGLHGLAADYDRKLAGPLADAPGLDGMTGRELAAKWASAASAAWPAWPTGKVAVREMASGAGVAPRAPPPASAIRFERADAILGLATAQLSARGGELALEDGLGREFFRTNLEHEAQVYSRPSGGNVYAVARGNLLVVSLGRQMTAFNTLAAANVGPAQLWKASLTSNLEYAQVFYGQQPGGGAARPGSFRAPRAVEDEKWIGVIGPVTAQGVVFQDQRRLMCVDALTGELRWSRSDVPPGCDLFGDDRHVLAVPMGSTKALVFSAMDGRAMGQANVPPWRNQLVALGANLICWQRADDQYELTSLNPVAGTTGWKHRFAANAQVDVERGRYVAVAEPGGRVVVVDAADGTICVDYSGPVVPRVDEVHLAVGRDTFFVAVRRPRVGPSRRNVQPLHALDSQILDGYVLLFDRWSGAMRWNRPAEVLQQGLLLAQPVDLPLIVFAGQIVSEAGAGRPTSKLMILDRATGRTLYQKDDLPQNGNYCVARLADAASRQAAVEMAGRTILLQFTDGRRPPEPPALAEVESADDKGSGGLMGIIFGIGN